MQAEIIGTASALLTTTAFLPQVVKAVKTRKTDDLSYGMLLLQSTGNVGWVSYGWMMHSASIAVSNVVTCLRVGTLLAVKVRQAVTDRWGTWGGEGSGGAG